MSNAEEIYINNGYTVNFYKIKADNFMKVTNRNGDIIGVTKISSEEIEALKSKWNSLKTEKKKV